MDDERIIELFLARDEGAVTAASEKYGAYCRAVALGMLGDERDAQRVNGDVPRDAPRKARRLRASLRKALISEGISI